MATTKDYKEFLLERLSILDDITCRPMMGEYLLYYKDKLFGGIYDNRLLIKIVEGNKKFGLEEAIPYENAKAMYLVDNLDDEESLKEIIITTYKELPSKTKGKKK